MKRIITICAATLITASVFAQSPEKMSYQAVVRNASNVLVTSANVGMRISIVKDSAQGAAVYVETQKPTTNANGLVSIEIGNGTIVSGTFSTINWAKGPYFIKTETDPTGGSTYTITGTSQLLSVPYALHAKTAETANETDPLFSASTASAIKGTDTARWSNKQDKLPNGNAGGDVLHWTGTKWMPDNNMITISDTNVVMNNSFSFSDGFYLAYFTNNNLSFVNDHSYIQVYPNGTPANRAVTLPNGQTNGQMLILACNPYVAAGNGFRLVSSGNIKLNGGGSLDLLINDTIMLLWNGQSWTEISRSNN